MKSYYKYFLIVGSLLLQPAFASDLMWDDIEVIPAIKVESNKFRSCKKGFTLTSLRSYGQKLSNKEQYDKDYICISKSSEEISKVNFFTAQELAKEYIGPKAVAVGTHKHKLDQNPGEFTVDNIYIELYYKNKN